MKSIATVMQLTRSLLILTPAEYDRPEGGLKTKKASFPASFGVPQIFELNDSLKERPYEKSDELSAFVKRCAESIGMELGDLFICIEDEDILITKEYKHPVAKPKLLQSFAHGKAEELLHNEVSKYTVKNFEYGQQYGKANKSEDVSASLFAMNTDILADIRVNFERDGIRVVKIAPPIAGMLYTSKVDLNSATRAIALISMDFAATRLVVLHNGAPVFQQSFSSVLEDIAEMFSLEFGISKLGAIDLIRKEGLGVCNRCHSASTKKQTMSMLDNAAGEILRNLRLVISTLRLDIDTIVLCDALSKIPNIGNYCRSVGLTAPIENVATLFTGSGTTTPTATPAASEKGYDMSSFVTFNGLLNMPMDEANLISGEANIASVIAAQGSNKIGNAIAGVLVAAAILWMAGTGVWYIALEAREAQDTNTVNSSDYDTAKRLISEEAEYTLKLQNLELDLETLPRTTLKSKDIVNELFSQVVEKVNEYEGWSITRSSEQITISTSIVISDFDAYDDLRNEIDETGYFYCKEGYSVVNGDDGLSGDLILIVTDETIAEAEAAAETEATESDGQDASTEESTDESSGS